MSTVSKKVQQLTTDYVHQIFRNLRSLEDIQVSDLMKILSELKV
jgi:hypothetical protein